MTEEQALLAAVVATPDDDLPRLVLADWLDEHGQEERAEFIRVQIAVERHPARLLNPAATYGEFFDLREREEELAAHAALSTALILWARSVRAGQATPHPLLSDAFGRAVFNAHRHDRP